MSRNMAVHVITKSRYLILLVLLDMNTGSVVYDSVIGFVAAFGPITLGQSVFGYDMVRAVTLIEDSGVAMCVPYMEVWMTRLGENRLRQ